MKKAFIMVLGLTSLTAFSQTLPVITASPANLTVVPGNTATFNVTATGATSYQWRFNGANISDGTNATLQVINTQSTNIGYYNVIAKNSTGWVPSQMAWLAVIQSNGVVPLSNLANSNNYLGQAGNINGSAQVMAGPALDQMQIVGGFNNKAPVSNGWFNLSQSSLQGVPPVLVTTNKNVTVPNVAAGQTVYYAVYITYTNGGMVETQQSTVISLTAGGNGYDVPSLSALKFPQWIEWPDPIFEQAPFFLWLCRPPPEACLACLARPYY